MKKRINISDEFLAEQGHTRESYDQLTKSGQWSVRNREKHYTISKKHRAENSEQYSKKRREYGLSKSYGITEEDYSNILESQNGCCAICNTDKPTGKWNVFVVDHNHDTGEVRGLLCNKCNRGIGYLKDSPDILRNALDYILKHDKKTLKEKQSKKKTL